jgi:hypothetical protein
MMKILVRLPQGMRVQKRFLPEFEINLPYTIIQAQCKGETEHQCQDLEKWAG